MRVNLAHEGREAEVRRADRANPAIGLRGILHQPVDRVVSIRRFIDPAVIERPDDRPRHDESALRSMQAADVLDGDYIAIVRELLYMTGSMSSIRWLAVRNASACAS